MKVLRIEGKIISCDAEKYGEISINQETGLIEEVSEPSGKADIIASDCLIFPGFGDLHVHTREDQSGKLNYKEDFTTASNAAINGGVTFAMDLTNNFLPLIDEATYLARRKLADSKASIDLFLAAIIAPGTKPFSFSVPYKVFMSHSVGGLFFKSKEQLEETIRNYQGKTVIFHCEDPDVLHEHEHEATHEAKRPMQAEWQGIGFALNLIEKYQIKGRIGHVSTKEGLEKILVAKKRGVDVQCEVTPHHLYFDQEMLNEKNHKWLQVNPPIRPREDRLALIKALKNGDIDFLASDHAPHTKEEKLAGSSGMPQLDTYGAFTTWLMSEHGFSPQDICRVSSFKPGSYVKEFLPENSGKGFGKIEPGFIGSLSIIDMNAASLINAANLKTKCGWSPFEGVKFAGSVKYAIIRGRVYQN